MSKKKTSTPPPAAQSENQKINILKEDYTELLWRLRQVGDKIIKMSKTMNEKQQQKFIEVLVNAITGVCDTVRIGELMDAFENEMKEVSNG